MEFDHIIQAISYARETGDTQALTDYADHRVGEVSKRLLSLIGKLPMRGDDPYFLLAYCSALVDVHRASMSEEERMLVDSIKNGIKIMVVKTAIPVERRGDDTEEDEDT